jgi:hypothetical protein
VVVEVVVLVLVLVLGVAWWQVTPCARRCLVFSRCATCCRPRASSWSSAEALAWRPLPGSGAAGSGGSSSSSTR